MRGYGIAFVRRAVDLMEGKVSNGALVSVEGAPHIATSALDLRATVSQYDRLHQALCDALELLGRVLPPPDGPEAVQGILRALTETNPSDLYPVRLLKPLRRLMDERPEQWPERWVDWTRSAEGLLRRGAMMQQHFGEAYEHWQESKSRGPVVARRERVDL